MLCLSILCSWDPALSRERRRCGLRRLRVFREQLLWNPGPSGNLHELPTQCWQVRLAGKHMVAPVSHGVRVPQMHPEDDPATGPASWHHLQPGSCFTRCRWTWSRGFQTCSTVSRCVSSKNSHTISPCYPSRERKAVYDCVSDKTLFETHRESLSSRMHWSAWLTA